MTIETHNEKPVENCYYTISGSNLIYKAQDSIPVSKKYADIDDANQDNTYLFLVFDLSQSDKQKVMMLETIDVEQNMLIPATKEKIECCTIIERIFDYESPDDSQRIALWKMAKIVESISHAKGLLDLSSGRLAELASTVRFENQSEIFNKLNKLDAILSEIEDLIEFENVKFIDERKNFDQ